MAGNQVSTAAGLYIYTCILANKNVQPGVGTNWPVYWLVDQPIFQGSWANEGGSLQAMRFRLSVGRPHILDYNTGAITAYSDHQLELQGSVTMGASYPVVSIIFYLPLSHTPQNNLRLAATDDVGGMFPFSVKNDGSVWYGIA